jgi:hypothetical protein
VQAEKDRDGRRIRSRDTKRQRIRFFIGITPVEVRLSEDIIDEKGGFPQFPHIL